MHHPELDQRRSLSVHASFTRNQLAIASWETLPCPGSSSLTTIPRSVESCRRPSPAGAMRSRRRPRAPRRPIEAPDHIDALVGVSPAIRAVFKRIGLAAASDLNVLITGESGRGKELVAGAIHESSPRAEAPFRARRTANPTSQAASLASLSSSSSRSVSKRGM